jgi:glutaredoxin
MYGAYWCPHCAEQKALFGEAAKELPYVECDPSGVNPRPDLCEKVGVKSFPTWVVGGERREGVQSLETLAELSKFDRSPTR